MAKQTPFSFGKNWQDFLRRANEKNFHHAKSSLIDSLGGESLRGRSFLDIGCGSGLFSHAAFTLGASRVVSLDLDPLCVKCCEALRQKAGNPKCWEIYQGSILDKDFMSRLGLFDVVYAWGVLHHTGKMWEAIQNTACLVQPGGFYNLAIYNKSEKFLGSRFWLRVKKIYNRSPSIGKTFLEVLYMAVYFLVQFKRLKNPFKQIRRHESGRGMIWRRDIVDWLGGYPYEFAAAEEILGFMKSRFPKWDCVDMKSTRGLGNNLYLFRRTFS